MTFMWKIAKVSPFFKSDSLFDRSNFALSQFWLLSLELHVHNYFYHFLTEYIIFLLKINWGLEHLAYMN
jgi:hypothetical protein